MRRRIINSALLLRAVNADTAFKYLTTLQQPPFSGRRSVRQLCGDPVRPAANSCYDFIAYVLKQDTS
jgi:hypothetical protein